MNVSVSFKLAKLLNERNYDKFSNSGYTESGEIYLHQGGQEPVKNGQQYYEGINYTGNEFYCAAPTIGEVDTWLFEKYDIDVSAYGKLPYIVFPDSEFGEGELQWHFEYKVIQNRDGQKCEIYEPQSWFDTKKEAYETGIEYALKNLI